jgi:hypothetical protein
MPAILRWAPGIGLDFYICVTLRLDWFFHPGRQQLQVEQIGSLDRRRCHRLHLLE